MKTPLTEMFGIDVPIFAFSHCRDVVVEVSRAGGMGIFGLARMTLEQLEIELNWIDAHIDGKPYGVDVLIPNNYEKLPNKIIGPEDLPREQVEFMRKVLDDAGVPRLPEDNNQALLRENMAHVQLTPEQARGLIEIALRHPIKAVVNALGVPPPEMTERLHAHGVKVGALTGKVEHALNQQKAGVDFVVAQGTEAGGHVGKIASMILWPQIVDAVAPMPVLAAGGVGNGRQMAAAMALGAAGVWCGSIWLGTRESDLEPEMKELFWEASAEDAVTTRVRTGKPVRALRSKLTEAWEKPGAPPFLRMPYQTLLMCEPDMRTRRARRKDYMYYPVGQIVSSMHGETSCKQIVYDMMVEFVEATERLNALVQGD